MCYYNWNAAPKVFTEQITLVPAVLTGLWQKKNNHPNFWTICNPYNVLVKTRLDTSSKTVNQFSVEKFIPSYYNSSQHIL